MRLENNTPLDHDHDAGSFWNFWCCCSNRLGRLYCCCCCSIRLGHGRLGLDTSLAKGIIIRSAVDTRHIQIRKVPRHWVNACVGVPVVLRGESRRVTIEVRRVAEPLVAWVSESLARTCRLAFNESPRFSIEALERANPYLDPIVVAVVNFPMPRRCSCDSRRDANRAQRIYKHD